MSMDRRITGDITRSDSNIAEQWSEEQFLEEVDAILARPGVEALIFTAYTPFFNDGDACIWSMVDVGVDVPEWDDKDGRGYHSIDDSKYLIGYYYEWKDGRRTENWNDYIKVHFDIPDPELSRRVQEFFDNGDHYENVIKKHFGDHCEVRCTKEGFDVSYYDHD